MEELKNELSAGEKLFLEFSATKKYSEITARINKDGEIYLIETKKIYSKKANDGIIPSTHFPKSGYHNLNFYIADGKPQQVTTISKHKINGRYK